MERSENMFAFYSKHHSQYSFAEKIPLLITMLIDQKYISTFSPCPWLRFPNLPTTLFLCVASKKNLCNHLEISMRENWIHHLGLKSMSDANSLRGQNSKFTTIIWKTKLQHKSMVRDYQIQRLNELNNKITCLAAEVSSNLPNKTSKSNSFNGSLRTQTHHITKKWAQGNRSFKQATSSCFRLICHHEWVYFSKISNYWF